MDPVQSPEAIRACDVATYKLPTPEKIMIENGSPSIKTGDIFQSTKLSDAETPPTRKTIENLSAINQDTYNGSGSSKEKSTMYTSTPAGSNASITDISLTYEVTSECSSLPSSISVSKPPNFQLETYPSQKAGHVKMAVNSNRALAQIREETDVLVVEENMSFIEANDDEVKKEEPISLHYSTVAPRAPRILCSTPESQRKQLDVDMHPVDFCCVDSVSSVVDTTSGLFPQRPTRELNSDEFSCYSVCLHDLVNPVIKCDNAPCSRLCPLVNHEDIGANGDGGYCVEAVSHVRESFVVDRDEVRHIITKLIPFLKTIDLSLDVEILVDMCMEQLFGEKDNNANDNDGAAVADSSKYAAVKKWLASIPLMSASGLEPNTGPSKFRSMPLDGDCD